MASTNHLLLFLLSASVLLAGKTISSCKITAQGGAMDTCQPGKAFPHNPLSTCRTYVVSQACGRGPGLPMLAKARCCRELAAVPGRCRCEALRVFMYGVRAPGIVGAVEGQLRDLHDCPMDAQRAFAATLMSSAQCNVHSGDAPCDLVVGGQVPMYD